LKVLAFAVFEGFEEEKMLFEVLADFRKKASLQNKFD